MRFWQACLITLALGGLLAQAASCQWQETRITGDGASPYTPKTWGGVVYWTDSRDYQTGYVDIRKWESGTETVIRQLPWAWGNDIEAIYQDDLVLMRGISSSNWDLYRWNAGTGVETAISTAPGKQHNADIYQGTVVWEDHRDPNLSEIYIWDEAGGERVLSPSGYNQTVPKIWGQGADMRVTWQQEGQYGPEIHSYTPSEGTQLIGGGISPAVYENKIVWWTSAYYNPYPIPFQPGYLFQWTPAGGGVLLAEHNYTAPFATTDIWGDLIAVGLWDTGAFSALIAWDPANGLTRPDVGTGAAGRFPSVYSNQIAWVGNDINYRSNIWLSTLVPEPAPILALSSFAGGLLLIRLRKRRYH